MLEELSSIANSINADQAGLTISSENINKVNIIGAKRQTYSFSSLFSRLLNPGVGSGTSDGLGGTNPQQVGMGSKLATVQYDFTAGDKKTGDALSLYLDNPTSLFMVSKDNGNTYQYTRGGDFKVDAQNNLLTSTGLPVYGFPTSADGTRSPQLQPIVLPKGTTGAWDNQGFMTVTDPQTGQTIKVFQIALTSFSNPAGLGDGGDNTFVETTSSGKPYVATVPGSPLGTVTAGSVESSNVDVMAETLQGIVPAERYLQAKYTAMQALLNTTDKFLQSVTGGG